MKTGKTVYGIITEQVLEMMAKGTVPWKKPWKTRGDDRPINYVSRKPYRGINVMMTLFKQDMNRYPTGEWLTFKQAQALGGQVRKGEKGTQVIFWKFLNRKEKDGTLQVDAKGRPLMTPMLRYYTVFNLAQVDGLESKLPKVEPVVFDPIKEAEAIIDGYLDRGGPTIEPEGGSIAAYSPSMDTIRIPKRTDFQGVGEYYSTVFHELGHSTGHKRRLARPGIIEHTRFGDHAYSQEELVAEFTSAFLMGRLGIESTLENSAAYLKHWSEKLKENERWVVLAAAQAQKAADLIAPPPKEEAPAVEEKELVTAGEVS